MLHDPSVTTSPECSAFPFYQARISLGVRSLSLLLLGTIALSHALLPVAFADTVYLKDGTQILDCKVVNESATAVSLRTPVGDMVVPRDRISRIVRTLTNYDTYEAELKRLKPKDANARYKLASWCRQKEGLRKESDALLAEVLELEPDHSGAHRLLGHVLVNKEWMTPDPISVAIVVTSTSGDARDLRDRFAHFLGERTDFRVVDEKAAKKLPETDVCFLDVAGVVQQKAGTKLYGGTIGRAWLVGAVTVAARGEWVGKSTRTTLASEVPAAAPDATNLALKNALSGSSRLLHSFLDRLRDTRGRIVAKDLAAKKEREEDVEKKSGSKKAAKEDARPARGKATASS